MRFSVDMSGKIAYKVFLLDNPDRLVIDLIATQRGQAFPVGKTLNAYPIKAIRSGIQEGTNLRIVLDLAAPIALVKKELVAGNKGGKGYTLVITFSSKNTLVAPQTLPSTAKEEAVEGQIEEQKETLETKPAALPLFIPIPVARPSTPPEQVDLAVLDGRPLIVIDPGHGGTDPGTQGYAKTYEKQLTLAYGLALKKAIERTGRYRVLLTRSKDVYVGLKERVHIARTHKGSLFISLHADAHADKHMRGLSVYTLSETASDKEAEALAAKENKVGLLEDVDLDTKNPEVAGILIDIIQRETANASSLFAESLISEVGQNVTLLKYPHRFAGFRVLTAPDIPSLLVELGYLSNPDEEKLLNSPAYKKKVVNAIIRSIDVYVKHNRIE